MPGFDEKTAIVVLWGLAALAMAWTWLPALIAALGGTRYSCGGAADLHGLEPSAAEPDYSFWAEQLLALGYEPLGRGWSRVNFAGPEWSLRTPLRLFRHPQKQCYALMQMAPAPFHFWPGAVFATVWADGGILLTDNNVAADPHPDDEYIRQGVVSLKLADVESLHLATMEVLRRGGRRIDPAGDIDSLLHALERHLGPEARTNHGRAGLQYLLVHGLIHLCVTTPAAYISGVTHWSVPLVNLVLAMILLYGESSQKRQYARAVRAALRARQALPLEQRVEPEV
jgi:hypothetical protein